LDVAPCDLLVVTPRSWQALLRAFASSREISSPKISPSSPSVSCPSARMSALISSRLAHRLRLVKVTRETDLVPDLDAGLDIPGALASVPRPATCHPRPGHASPVHICHAPHHGDEYCPIIRVDTFRKYLSLVMISWPWRRAREAITPSGYRSVRVVYLFCALVGNREVRRAVRSDNPEGYARKLVRVQQTISGTFQSRFVLSHQGIHLYCQEELRPWQKDLQIISGPLKR